MISNSNAVKLASVHMGVCFSRHVGVNLQNVPNLPSVKRERREPGLTEELPQPPLNTRHLRRAAASRVPNRRHLLSTRKYLLQHC